MTKNNKSPLLQVLAELQKQDRPTGPSIAAAIHTSERKVAYYIKKLQTDYLVHIEHCGSRKTGHYAIRDGGVFNLQASSFQ